MSSLPSISHRLFVAAVAQQPAERPKTAGPPGQSPPGKVQTLSVGATRGYSQSLPEAEAEGMALAMLASET